MATKSEYEKDSIPLPEGFSAICGKCQSPEVRWKSYYSDGGEWGGSPGGGCLICGECGNSVELERDTDTPIPYHKIFRDSVL